jgi:hypothetical protein
MSDRLTRIIEGTQRPADPYDAQGYLEGGVAFGSFAGLVEVVFVAMGETRSIPAQTLVAGFALAGAGFGTYGAWLRQHGSKSG